MTTLYIDVETVPQGAREHRALCGDSWRGMSPPEHALTACPQPSPVERGNVPSNFRDPAKIAAKKYEIKERYERDKIQWLHDIIESAWSWWRAGSLTASRGEIVTVGYAYDDDDPACLVAWGEATEGDILAQLWGVVQERRPRRVVAHNASFDAGMLFGRAMRHGLHGLAGAVAEPHYRLRAALKLWDAPTIVDTRDLWPLPTSARGEGTLDEIARALDIDRAANPIGGAEVLDAYLDGRIGDIVGHNLDDVRVLREVYRTLSGVWGIR